MKKEIILLYATATSQLNILKLNAEALMLANVQYSIAKRISRMELLIRELYHLKNLANLTHKRNSKTANSTKQEFNDT